MNIMLGDLTVSQIEKRIGVDFPEEIRDFMNSAHQSSASNVQPGKWHCFDIPFNIVCGDVQTATKIFKSVKDAKVIKERLQFSVSNS